MWTETKDIDAVEQPVQLAPREGHHEIAFVGPWEAGLLESLHPQYEATAFPIEKLHAIAGSSVIPHTDLVPSLLSIAGIRCTGNACRCSGV